MKAQIITRRDFGKWCATSGIVATSGVFSSCLLAQTNAITPIVPGPEVDEFKKAQQGAPPQVRGLSAFTVFET